MRRQKRWAAGQTSVFSILPSGQGRPTRAPGPARRRARGGEARKRAARGAPSTKKNGRGERESRARLPIGRRRLAHSCHQMALAGCLAARGDKRPAPLRVALFCVCVSVRCAEFPLLGAVNRHSRALCQNIFARNTHETRTKHVLICHSIVT